MSRLQSLHRGSTLVMVILASTLFLGFIAVLFSFSGLLQTQASRETRIRQGIALGNSGLNRALATYRTNPNYQGELNVPYSTGAVDLYVTGSDPVVLTSLSYVPNKTSPSRVCRAFQVDVDPTTAAIVPQTYRESGCEPGTEPTPAPSNQAPTLTITSPVAPSQTIPAGQPFTFNFILTDPDPADVVSARFYTVPENKDTTQKLPIGACSIMNRADTFCTWTIPTTFVPGTYYIYGEASDGIHGDVTAFSPGKLVITPVGTPLFAIIEPDGTNDIALTGTTYPIVYALYDAESTVKATLYYTTNLSTLDRTNHVNDACGNETYSGSTYATATCNWTTPGVGTYYIYGVVTDDPSLPEREVVVINPNPVQVVSNAPATLSILDPDGTNDTVTAGDTYPIRYTLSDADDDATVDFYVDLDGDNLGFAGASIGSCLDQGEGTNATCNWNTTGITPGSYYIFGRVTNDPFNRQIQAYSPGRITINEGPDVNAAPTLIVEWPSAYGNFALYYPQMPQLNILHMLYRLTDDEETVTAQFYLDDDQDFSNGTKYTLSGSCANAVEGNPTQCAATLPTNQGVYYVVAKTTDGVNPEVVAYSPGRFEIDTVTFSGQCNDGVDNDGNGKTDYPSDPGCATAWDYAERGEFEYSDYPTAMVRDGNGNLYVGGHTDLYHEDNALNISAIRKYTSNGQLCKTGTLSCVWGTNNSGHLSIAQASKIWDLAVDGSNNLYVLGGDPFSATRIWKYQPNGQFITVLPAGLSAPFHSHKMLIDGNGKIYLAGRYYERPAGAGGSAPPRISIVRLNADGTPDISWGTNGITIFRNAYSSAYSETVAGMAFGENGSVYVTGHADQWGLYSHTNTPLILKFTSSGAMDTGFNSTGALVETQVNGRAHGIVRHPTSNDIYVIGNSTWGMRRYSSSGSLIATVTPPVLPLSIALSPNNNSYLLAGQSNSGLKILKYNTSNNALDGSWNMNSTMTAGPIKIVFDPGNSFAYVISQLWTSNYGGSLDWLLQKYNTSGGLDTSFNPGFGYGTTGSVIYDSGQP